MDAIAAVRASKGSRYLLVMSSSIEQAVEVVCASCGITGGDGISLKICTACKLVRYCSVDCQKNHRSQHKKACRKRAAEIRDDNLFRQPEESYLGECPICCLPLPTDATKSGLNSCCSKFICRGCSYANQKREIEQSLEHKCPFCRAPLPKTDEEMNQNYMERIKTNDPVAIHQMGKKCKDEGDYEGAFQYLTKAVEMGDIGAHYNLSVMYSKGEGVERDEKKKSYHLEEAAIGGHPDARYNLGCHTGNAGRIDIAMRHFIIAAKLGFNDALEEVKKGFQRGEVSKEDFEAALRGHQAAVDATKSEQREEAHAFYNLSPEEQDRRWVRYRFRGTELL